MSELKKRIYSALVAAPLFLFVTWVGGWFFIVMLVVLSMGIQLEVIHMLKKLDLDVRKVPALLMGIPVLLIPVEPALFWSLFLILLLFTWIAITFHSNRNTWNQLMTTTLVGIAFPALISGLLTLRNFGDDTTGFTLTIALLLMVWTNDILAFIGGKSMGKIPLAPGISPKKTVEGFLFGFLGCFIALGLVMSFLPGYSLSLAWSIPFAVVVGLFGPAGDLAESKLKRICGIKDSSGLMPGHGGVYDRLDAVLFAAPASAIYFQFLHYFNFL